MPPTFAATDALRYLALALVWTFAGRGILALTQTGALGNVGWLIAPAITQAFVAVVLGATTVVGVPTHVLSAPLWLATIVLAVTGALSAWRSGGSNAARTDSSPLAGPALVTAAALGVPAIALLPYFVHGFGSYAGTTHPDAWVYITFGDYLWHYPRLTQGDLTPVYQFASTFSFSRFVSPAQLGWLATATQQGDSQAALGLLLTLNTFIVGCACGAVARAFRLSAPLALLAAVAGGGGNWISNAILVSNLDSLLALSYLPALVALALVDRGGTRFGRASAFGLLVAGATYTFPEFAVLVCWGAALHVAGTVRTRPAGRPLADLLLGALVAAVLILPIAGHLSWFLQHQLTAGMSIGTRPAEGLYSGLIDLHDWPASLWALGPEHAGVPTSWTTAVAAATVSLFFVVGLGRLISDRQFSTLATMATFAAGFGVFAWVYDYGYGAYKFVLFGWWLMVVTVAIGAGECRRLHPIAGRVAAVSAMTLFLSSAGHAARESAMPPHPDISAYRTLSKIEPLTHGAPIAMAVADEQGARWAAYFLRGARTRLVWHSGVFAAPFVQSAMAATDPIPWTDLRLLLTETTDTGPFVEQRAQWKRLWSSDDYTLWDTSETGWAILWKVENGYPYAAGPGLVWIGDKPAIIHATANGDGVIQVNSKLALSQPLSETVPVRLVTTDDMRNPCERRVPYDGFSLSFRLRTGENMLTIGKSAPVGIKVLPEADQRHPFMVGLLNPTIAFQPGLQTSPSCPQESTAAEPSTRH